MSSIVQRRVGRTSHPDKARYLAGVLTGESGNKKKE